MRIGWRVDEMWKADRIGGGVWEFSKRWFSKQRHLTSGLRKRGECFFFGRKNDAFGAHDGIKSPLPYVYSLTSAFAFSSSSSLSHSLPPPPPPPPSYTYTHAHTSTLRTFPPSSAFPATDKRPTRHERFFLQNRRSLNTSLAPTPARLGKWGLGLFFG